MTLYDTLCTAAHVGVGISGREGQQAVLSSDYSFGQFRSASVHTNTFIFETRLLKIFTHSFLKC